MNLNHFKFFAQILTILCLVSCSSNKNDEALNNTDEPVEIIIPTATENIKNNDNVLVAAIKANTPSYFIYKARTMGFDYEILQKFAEHLEVELKVIAVEDEDSMINMLNRGEIDIIASASTVTIDKKEAVIFTDRLYHSSYYLIQKKPSNWETLSLRQISNSLTRNILNLNNEPIHVIKNSNYHRELIRLSENIGYHLNIVEVDTITSAIDLMEMVDKGTIKYTIAEEQEASIFTSLYNKVDCNTAMSMPQQRAWAVRHNSTQIVETFNTWLKNYKRYKEYYFIYDKYFNNPATIKKLIKSRKLASTGPLSAYDDILRKESQRINWDWRLVAAQVYQESNFKENLESRKGAQGLMQVLKTTGDMHGFENLHHPETNIKAGIAHLEYIIQKFEDLDSINLIKFSLASYNVGVGHVYDAQRLATHLGLNPNVWDDNVAKAILLKSKREYYSLPECRNGYCRGTEPFNYVSEILERFQNYKVFVKE